MILLLLACTPAPTGEVLFLRDAVRRADGTLEARAWSPGETVDGAVAPKVPDCAPLFHVELEDRAQEAALGVPAPGAAMAFSPDGGTLAIGSVGGAVILVDGTTGRELRRRTLPEAAVKRVAWSADGATLYVGEQSPDASFRALDAATLTDRWSVRLADDIERTVLPPKDDIYGLYSLPAVFSVRPLPDGSVLVAGAHGWASADGQRKNRSRLYRFGAGGERLAAWPPDGAVDGVMLNPAVDGDLTVIGLSRSADGPPPPGLPIGGVLALETGTLAVRWTQSFPTLEPHFHEVFLWDALDVGPHHVFLGLGDGRAFVLDRADGKVATALTPGVPVLAQGVPIAAGVGFSTLAGETAYFLTTATNIPWGSADPATRPPAPHPAQYTIHALDLPGTAAWSRQVEQSVQGVAMAPDGRALLVGAGDRSTDERTDLFGALLLDPRDGGVITTCPTEGPVDFRMTWAPDAHRFAVAEAPFKVGAEVRGAYRVTVFR